MQCFQEQLCKRNSLCKYVIFASFFLLFLAGCTSVPQRSPSPLSLPDTFSNTGEAPVDTRWWLSFNDPSLNQYIETALSKNFSLLATRERIVQARAVARQAGAPLIPSVDGEGSASSRRDYQAGANTNSISLGIAASYEIDLWGRLRNLREAALLELEATEADFATAQLSLAAEVALNWFQIVEATQQLELLEAQKETNEKVLEVITTQFRSGKTDISDVLQQRQLVESNRGALAKLAADKRIFWHQLAILTGRTPDKELRTVTSDLPKLPGLPKTGIPLILVTRRPDVSGGFMRLQAADQRSAAAVASRFPRLSLSASLTTAGDSAKDLFSDWFSTLSANLVGPIIDGGFLKAEVEKTESAAREQLNSYSQTVLEAIGEVEDSLVREEELLLSLESETIQLQLATETVGHVGNRYRQGVEDYQRVLLALISEQNLQRSLVASKLALLRNRVSLYRALSGPVEQNYSDETKGEM